MLLGLVYWQTSLYMVHRIDDSIYTMSRSFPDAPTTQVTAEINRALIYDLRKSNLYGLFDSSGRVIAGNMKTLPGQSVDGEIHQFPYSALPRDSAVSDTEPAGLARAVTRKLADGKILVIGRDFTQMAEIKSIILDALIASGAVIIGIGLISGFALSVRPLRRINAIRLTALRIMQGDLSLRIPASKRRDELDMLAAIVNLMLEEIERLLTEVKSVSDNFGARPSHTVNTPAFTTASRAATNSSG